MMEITAPLIGRDGELQILRARLAAAREGNGSLVLIGGEAGVGKSTLVSCFLAESTNARAAVGRCPGPGETPPFGPFRESLHALAGEADHPLGAGAVQNRNARELAAALLAYFSRAGMPLILVLEDLHWSDPSTLEVLRHVTPLLAQSRVLIVATFRNDELNRDHPLWTLLPGLQRTGAQRILLSRLDFDSVVRVVQAVLPDPHGQLARRLHNRTGGNPLFLTEMLAAMAHDGAEPGNLPDTVLQAIDLKLAQVSLDTLAIISVGALIGERFEYTLLAAVAGKPDEMVADMLEQGLALRILRVDGEQGEHFAFDHALVREALLARMIAPRRRRWHRAIAEVLMQAAQPDPDRVALHLSRADDARAVEWLLIAGDRALRLGALAQARQLYERALQMLQGPDLRRGELLLKLGQATAYQNPEQARQYWEEAALAAAENSDEAVAAWTRHLQLVLRSNYQQTDERCLADLAALQEWQERLQADARYLKLEGDLFGKPCGFPRIAGERARTLAWVGRPEESRVVVAAIEERVAPGPHLADLIYSQVPILIWAGEWDRVFALLRQVRDYRVQLHQYRLAASMEFSRLYSLLYFRPERVADIDENAQTLEAYERQAIERAGDGTTPGGYSPLGVLQFFRGDWDGARRNLLEYYRQYPQEDRILRRVPAAQLARALGDIEAARQLLALFQTYHPTDPAGPVIINIELLTAWAELYMDTGELIHAAQWIELAEKWAVHLNTATWRGPIQTARARLSMLDGDPARAYAAIKAAFDTPAACESTFWQLSGHRLAGELAAALGERQTAEQHLRQSIALAEQCQVPYEAALSQLTLGSLLPEVPDAREHLLAARDAFVRLGARPALRRAEAALAAAASDGGDAQGPSGTEDGLTEREREIARLVAQGLTDKEVAAKLFISPRTVDRHLRNIYVKLNISSRSALGAYAVRAGLLG
ncbi:MAG: transcriptional regulator, LuxR family [Symbiobacteriaceae bacterium]|jgi:DNA-binding CsgD family transcriptional regulator|nr:transcriptional regulator, LuxR family [Symbiobacteriaceae bacterium]